MKTSKLSILVIFLSVVLSARAQKTFSEGTVVYDIVIQGKSSGAQKVSSLSGSKSILYIKGVLSRTEMVSSLGNETTIYNPKLGNAVILKEYSGQKLMITLTKTNWTERNQKFEGLKFQLKDDTKVVEGYSCKKAIAQLSDGSTISIFYTTDLNLMNKDYNQAFKSLPGFPMEYEFETDKLKFRYTVSSIDFNPLAAAKFDFPKSGYRVMSYDESRQGRRED